MAKTSVLGRIYPCQEALNGPEGLGSCRHRILLRLTHRRAPGLEQKHRFRQSHRDLFPRGIRRGIVLGDKGIGALDFGPRFYCRRAFSHAFAYFQLT